MDTVNPGAAGAAVVDPPSTPGTTDNGVPSTPGSVGAPPAPSPESPNIRQFREQYEATKQKLEPWEKIGADPRDVATHYPIIQKMRSEALELAEQLGYDKDEVQQFFAQDAVAVLAHLRQKAQSTQTTPLNPQDAKKYLDQRAEQLLKPYIDHQQEQLATQAELRGQNEFNRLLGEHFKDGLPDDCKADIYARVEAALLNDDAALQRLMKGQVSDVQKYFTQEKDKFLKVYTAYGQFERKRTGNEPPSVPGQLNAPKTRMDTKLSTGQTVRDLMNI